jgi:hypothetical protein
MLLTKFWFIWPSGFRGGDLKKLVNQKQELPVVAMVGNANKHGHHRQFLFLIGRYLKKFLL